MDLNPQIPDWSLAHGPYEIADHCISKKSNILVLLNAWLDSGKEPEETHDWSTLNYWAARTKPLWSNGTHDDDDDSDFSGEEQDASEQPLVPANETIVIVCNRTGQENGQTIFFSQPLLINDSIQEKHSPDPQPSSACSQLSVVLNCLA